MNSQSAPHVSPLDLTSQRVLRALFELGLSDCSADAGALARRLGLRASAVGQLLVQLDGLGLVRADRARLTLVGLATAARLPALESQVPLQPAAAALQPAHVPSATRQPSARAPEGAPLAARAPQGALARRTIRTGPSSVSL